MPLMHDSANETLDFIFSWKVVSPNPIILYILIQKVSEKLFFNYKKKTQYTNTHVRIVMRRMWGRSFYISRDYET